MASVKGKHYRVDVEVKMTRVGGEWGGEERHAAATEVGHFTVPWGQIGNAGVMGNLAGTVASSCVGSLIGDEIEVLQEQQKRRESIATLPEVKL